MKIGIIGSGHDTEIAREIIEGLKGKNTNVIIVSADIHAPPTLPEPIPIIPYREFDYNPPLTRKERRKLKRRNKE